MLTTTSELQVAVDRLDRNFGAHVAVLNPLLFLDLLTRTAGTLPVDHHDIVAVLYAPSQTREGDFELPLVILPHGRDEATTLAALRYAFERLNLHCAGDPTVFRHWSPWLWRWIEYVRTEDWAFERVQR